MGLISPSEEPVACMCLGSAEGSDEDGKRWRIGAGSTSGWAGAEPGAGAEAGAAWG